MSNEDLSVSDVLADRTKNLRNFYLDNNNTDADDEDEDDNEAVTLYESLYFTETDFSDFVIEKKYNNHHNVTIISINIANLHSKLNSLKCFLHNITTDAYKPDIIVIVETHINDTQTQALMTNH